MPTVALRAATPADIPLLDAWRHRAGTHSEFEDFGPRPAVDYADLVARDALVTEEGGVLLVVVDQVAIGSVSWHAVLYGPNPESRAWNIGIALQPGSRGRGYGTTAQRRLAEALFATTPVHRVEASTDVRNVAEQRALEKAGFSREGVLRGAQFRRGGWHDLVSYSRLRPDD
jgi:RimJ/RimL family protein N-acetyltransferase